MRFWLIAALSCLAFPACAALEDDMASLRHDWAVLKYQTTDQNQQISGLQKLANRAGALAAANPEAAEPVVWQAASLSTKASIVNGLSALGDVTRARDLALQAEKMNPSVSDGYPATILGALYHQVPGWPIAFGDDKKAARYFAKALAIDPDSLDANYYYGEYLLDKGDAVKARAVLEHALIAPPRPGMEIADTGRRAEVQKLLDGID